MSTEQASEEMLTTDAPHTRRRRKAIPVLVAFLFTLAAVAVGVTASGTTQALVADPVPAAAAGEDLGDGTTALEVRQRFVPEAVRAARPGFLSSLDELERHLAHLSEGRRS